MWALPFIVCNKPRAGRLTMPRPAHAASCARLAGLGTSLSFARADFLNETSPPPTRPQLFLFLSLSLSLSRRPHSFNFVYLFHFQLSAPFSRPLALPPNTRPSPTPQWQTRTHANAHERSGALQARERDVLRNWTKLFRWPLGGGVRLAVLRPHPGAVQGPSHAKSDSSWAGSVFQRRP